MIICRSNETITSSPEVTQALEAISNTPSPNPVQIAKFITLMFPAEWLKANPNYEHYVPIPEESVTREVMQRQLVAAVGSARVTNCQVLHNRR